MSILGKVLIFFNLLAAGAFAYFTLENWHVRQDLTTAAIVRDIQLGGFPVESSANPPAGLDADKDAFSYVVNNIPVESIPKKTIDAAFDKGDDIFGDGHVTSQSEELKRVQGKVFAHLAAVGPEANPGVRFQWLRAYLLAVARSGAERDGVNAIFDMRDPARAATARRDLPLAARTSSQTAALGVLVSLYELGDPQAITPETVRETRIAQVREVVRRFALGEAPYGVKADADKTEGERKLTNALLNALQPKAGDAARQEVVAAATGDPTGFEHVAAVAVEPLTDVASKNRAALALAAYAVGKAAVTTEAAAVTALAALINMLAPPAGNPDAEIEKAATNLLNSKFDDVLQPAATVAAKTGDPIGAKARRIAHLLYHIDGWRYADKTPAAVAARQAWHTRVATVVGLPEYIRAAEAQASEYTEAAQRLASLITEEQSVFEAEYQARLQRVLFLFSQWLALDTQLKAQQVITAENERLMSERKTERDKLLVELADSQEKAKVALETLKKTQQDLFAIQKQLRDAQEALLVLEKELRRLELGDEAVKVTGR